jgi:hypothetical protein
MRRNLLGVLALAAVAGLASADDPPAEKKESVKKAKADPGALEVDKDLPGPFEPYNVTGPRKGFFHSLVDEYGMDPTVMILVRDQTVVNTPLRFGEGEAPDGLLKRLDDLIDRNPAARLHAFTVFLRPDVEDPSANDDARAKAAKALEDQAAALGLKHVVLALDTPADVEKYLPTRGPWATVIVSDRLRIALPVRSLPRDAAEGQKDVDDLLRELTERFKLRGPKKAG